MSRSGRLFLLMDALRGNRRPVTAAVLAERLAVSERTIYRDIRTLSELGAPVDVVWPFALAFFEGKHVLAAWCELRAALRHFRIDRIASADLAGERYPRRRRELLDAWRIEYNIPDDS